MDTSETYIKMCDCEEIQWLSPAQVPIGDTKDYYHETGHGSTAWRYIWLPRQDQLQEMVFTVSPKTALDTFHLLAFMQFAYDEMDCVDSMEQLWLAFVMKEKYNKAWDGDKWEGE